MSLGSILLALFVPSQRSTHEVAIFRLSNLDGFGFVVDPPSGELGVRIAGEPLAGWGVKHYRIAADRASDEGSEHQMRGVFNHGKTSGNHWAAGTKAASATRDTGADSRLSKQRI